GGQPYRDPLPHRDRDFEGHARGRLHRDLPQPGRHHRHHAHRREAGRAHLAGDRAGPGGLRRDLRVRRPAAHRAPARAPARGPPAGGGRRGHDPRRGDGVRYHQPVKPAFAVGAAGAAIGTRRSIAASASPTMLWLATMAVSASQKGTRTAMALHPDDLCDVRSLLSEEERAVQDSVARFTDERVLPIIGDAFDQGRFPKELVPEIAEMGLLGSSLPEEYGCAGLNGVSYGLICQELERGDSGIRSFVSVQSSLCMYPIYAYGTEEQRKRWLPDMAAGKVIGCFGLTEPHGGSDPANMKTHA